MALIPPYPGDFPQVLLVKIANMLAAVADPNDSEQVIIYKIAQALTALMNGGGGGGGSFDPHSPGPFGDVTPDTVGLTVFTGATASGGSILSSSDDTGTVLSLISTGTVASIGLVITVPNACTGLEINEGSGSITTNSGSMTISGSLNVGGSINGDGSGLINLPNPFNQSLNTTDAASFSSSTSAALTATGSGGQAGIVASATGANVVGILGQADVGPGVYGLSSSGVGLKGTSTSGNRLQLVGTGADVIVDNAGNVTGATWTANPISDTYLASSVKPVVAVVAVANLTLSGEQTIDGQLTSASLVLATAQTTGSQNGPWITAAGSWTRPGWYTTGSATQAPQFLTTFVRLGTTYQGSTWRMTTASVTIGTTATTWVQTPTNLNSVIGSLNGVNIGATTRGTGAFTTLAANGAVTMTAGTASTSGTTGTLVLNGGFGINSTTADDGIFLSNSGVGGPNVSLDATNATAGNRYAQVLYKSSGTLQFSTGIRAGDATYHIYCPTTSREGITVAASSVVTIPTSLTIGSAGLSDPVLTVTGNASFSGNLTATTAGKGLQLKSGTGARAGNATLVGGTVTVTNSTTTANTIIIMDVKTAGGTLGSLSYTLSAGASFTITSSSAIDTSTVSFHMIELN